MKKRIFSMILVVCLFIPMLAIVASAASNDYTTWKQSDPTWNQTEAWPRSQYPNATLRKMSQAGCVVTSLAMLLRHYNVVTDSDVNRFNPWIVNEKLKENGCFDSAANLIWNKVGNAYPGLKYAGSKTYSLDTLSSLYNSGYACLVKVSESGGYCQTFTVGSTMSADYRTLTPRCAPSARLDVSNAGTGDCVNIQIWEANGTAAQSWRLVYFGNKYYAIQSKVSGRCLDVAGGNTSSGTNTWQYT